DRSADARRVPQRPHRPRRRGRELGRHRRRHGLSHRHDRRLSLIQPALHGALCDQPPHAHDRRGGCPADADRRRAEGRRVREEVSDMAGKPPVGSIGWCDLTISDACGARDFYRSVVGWSATELDMGGYADYVMNQPNNGTATAGVCWARGVNEGIPPVWLVYFVVASLDASLR